MQRRALALILLVGPMAALRAWARMPVWGDSDSQAAGTDVAALKQGQWVWQPALAPAGPVLVVVNLDQQLGYAYRNGVLIGYTTVSTGKKGHATPTGVFHTLQKDRDHHSSIYNNAPMPFTQRLTWGGVSLHAGGLPGYPSSHGCVHLPSAFAERLFEISPMGMTVVVAKRGGAPLDLEHPLPISPIDPRTGTVEHEPRLAASEHWRWQPQNAPQGSLALVFSRADERMVVLRGGVEVGRARASVMDKSATFGTHAFVAHAADVPQGAVAGARLRWMGVPVPGHAEDAGRTLKPAEFAHVRLPKGFLDALRSNLAPGATLVLVDAPILPETTGQPMTVVTNQPPET